MKKSRTAKLRGKNLTGILTVIAIGAIGSILLTASHADTAWTNHNAIGSIDDCSVSGSTTTIYGWANDPEAPQGNQPYANIKVGATTVNAPTNVNLSGPETKKIDAYITDHYPNQPHTGTYGFKATFTNLYKGNSFAISGTALNYGTGSNTAMAVNTTGTAIAGYSASPYFAGNKLPDSCLATPPAPSVSISASPTTITSGGSSTVTWSSHNTSSCAASGSWSGAKPTSGSAGTGTLKATATYKLTCSGVGGSASGSATVTVNPTGTPQGGGGGSSGGSGSRGSSSSSNSSGSSSAAPGNKADATVTAGSLGANLVIPADGASSVHITYGTSADLLINSTDEVNVSGSDVTSALDGLTAKTTYYYQIVRTNSVGATNSSTVNFATKGYTLAIGFQDANGDPVKDITGSLSTSDTAVTDSSTKQGKSDSDGVMSFSDLEEGAYTVTFKYKGTEHTLDYNTDTLVAAGSPDEVAVLSDTIDLSQFSTGSSSSQSGSHGSSAGKVVLIVLLLLAVAGTIWFIIRRRRRQATISSLPFEYATPPAPAPTPIPTPTVAPTPKASTPQPHTPLPSHAGESLRDMVIKSMHEQAQKRHQSDPPEPPSNSEPHS